MGDDSAEQKYSDVVVIPQLVPPVEDAPDCVYAPLPQHAPLCVKRPHLLTDLQKHTHTCTPASERNLRVRPDHTAAAATALVATNALILMRQPNRHARAVQHQRFVHIHENDVSVGGSSCGGQARLTRSGL